MIRLIQTILGLFFFVFFFTIILVKNIATKYEYSATIYTNLPLLTVFNELKKSNDLTISILPDETDYIFDLTTITSKVNNENHVLEREINKNNPSKIYEKWSINDHRVKLTIDYSLDIIEKMNLFFHPNSFNKIDTHLKKRIENLLLKTQKTFNEHRWSYIGEEIAAEKFYISLDGNSTWSDWEIHTIQALDSIRKFTAKNNITTQGKEFIFFPEIDPENIKWRVGLKVDRYYNIEETSFRSRRYRGGKSIALIHQGNFVHLYSSWKIITDSLEKNNYVQNYPNWLEKIYNESDSSDPTTWNTKLVIPIQ